ncbi:MAG: AraC family transcriptional regulator [Spirochaetales bacterium]|nr:AraC family transcriptional regulator [Spirochaetales bacterium]
MHIERHPRFPWIEIKTTDREYAIRKHSHKRVSLGLITEGTTTVTVHNTVFPLKEMDSIYIPADRVHLCRPDNENRFRFYMIYMDTKWFESAFGKGSTGDEDFPSSGAVGKEELLRFNSLLNQWHHPVDSSMKWEEAFIENLAGMLSSHNRLSLQERPGKIMNNELKEIRESLLADPEQSLDDICRNRNFSKYTLIRQFNTAYGLSPHAWQINERINSCIKWLKSGKGLAETALDGGFADQSHMIRTFKMYTGTTPGEFLNK